MYVGCSLCTVVRGDNYNNYVGCSLCGAGGVGGVYHIYNYVGCSLCGAGGCRGGVLYI